MTPLETTKPPSIFDVKVPQSADAAASTGPAVPTAQAVSPSAPEKITPVPQRFIADIHTDKTDPSKAYSVSDYPTIRNNVFESVKQAVIKRFPLENSRYQLTVKDVSYPELKHYSYADQKKALLNNSSLTVPLKGRWALVDKQTNSVVSESGLKTLVNVPYLTERGTYIRNGHELTLAMQRRLVPGVYARIRDTGEAEAHINVKPGSGRLFKMRFDPAKGKFALVIGTRKYALIPMLKEMGYSDSDIEKSFPNKDLYEANLDRKKPLIKTASEDSPFDASDDDDFEPTPVEDGDTKPTAAEERKQLAQSLLKAELNPRAVNATLGKPYDKVSAQMLLDTANRVYRVAKGETPDNRDSLRFYRFYDAPDLMAERIAKDSGGLARTLLYKVTTKGNVDSIPSNILGKHVDQLFTESRLGHVLEGTNPLDNYQRSTRITAMGEGGIGEIRAAPFSARLVHNSYKAFIDPVQSPEGMRAGIDSQPAVYVKKGPDGLLYTPLKNKLGKIEYVDSITATEKTVAMPGFKPDAKVIPCMKGDDIVYAKRADVDYYVPAPENLFSLGSNMVPLKSGVKAGRLLMGSKHSLHPKEKVFIRRSDTFLYVAVEDYEWQAGDEVISIEGDSQKWLPVRARLKHKRTEPIFEITLKDGKTLKTTNGHSWVTLDDSGELKEIAAADLKEGMPVPCVGRWAGQGIRNVKFKEGVNRAINTELSIPLTCDLAWAMGLYVAEGCILKVKETKRGLEDNRETGINIAAERAELRNKALSVFKAYGLNAAPARQYGKDRGVNIWGRALAVAFSSLFGEGADGKRIPECVMAADDRIRSAFLAGYFDGDGTVNLRKRDGYVRLSATTKSNELASDLQFLCALAGIETRHCLKWNARYKRHYNHIEVRVSTAIKIAPFLVHTDKAAKLSLYVPPHKRVTGWVPRCKPIHDAVLRNSNRRAKIRMYSFHNRLTRDKLQEIGIKQGDAPWVYSDVQWAPVKSVRVCKDEPPFVYDLDVGGGVFAAGPGIIIHNSASAMSLTNREAPSVMTANPEGNGEAFEQTIGKLLGAVKADKAGTVVDVNADVIKVRNSDGTTSSYDLYNNFPSNRITYHRNIANVKVGDKVSPNSVLAHSNYTDKEGNAALGTHLRMAYLPWKGYNYKDAVVLSESGAKKLTSEQLYHTSLGKEKGIDVDKAKYTSVFPGDFSAEQLKKVDDKGLVKVGTVLQKGDPLILGTLEKQPSTSSMGRSYMVRRNETWEHDYPGFVTDVAKTNDGWKVLTRANTPAQEGDKLAGSYGNKGVVARIIPDDQMPRMADGRHVELLQAPVGVISRTNVAQLHNVLLGKVAEKTGKRYVLPSFMDEDMTGFVEKELKQAGLTDREEVLDPETGAKIPGVTTGRGYYYKFHHMSEKKLGARSTASYTQDELPSMGGSEGAKHLGNLVLSALASWNAFDVIKDAKLIRGQKNDRYWADLKAGKTPVEPGTPLAYERFLAHLKGAGIRVGRDGDRTSIYALTAKDAEELVGNREVKSSDTFEAKSLKPLEGGLFAPSIFGAEGNNWGYIKLDTPLLNPIVEDQARIVLGKTKAQMEDLMGDPKALKEELGSVNVKEAITDAKQQLQLAKGAKRDKLLKKLRVLLSLEKNNATFTDFLLEKVPVLPPRFRRITVANTTTMVPDANYLYKEILDTRDDMRDAAKEGLPEEDIKETRKKLYKDFKALVGLTDPTEEKLVDQQVGGLLTWVFGKGSPKMGGFRRKVLGGTMDMVGRAAVAPDSNLTMDQVGIPDKMAWKLFEPFVIRKLVTVGHKPTDAVKMVSDKTQAAKDALLQVMDERPVLITRAPALHRNSIVAQKPVFVAGNAMKLNEHILDPFNADFDGDQLTVYAPTSEKAVKKALATMLPSKALIGTRFFKAHWLPEEDLVLGAHLALRRKEGPPKYSFNTKEEAIRAYHKGIIGASDNIYIKEDAQKKIVDH